MSHVAAGQRSAHDTPKKRYSPHNNWDENFVNTVPHRKCVNFKTLPSLALTRKICTFQRSVFSGKLFCQNHIQLMCGA